MDIQSRKIEFIQEFLKIDSEEVITQFEKLLEKIEFKNIVFPISVAELNRRIDRSERDFKNEKYKPGSELLSKYK